MWYTGALGRSRFCEEKGGNKRALELTELKKKKNDVFRDTRNVTCKARE